MSDLEDVLAVEYARIHWQAARRVYVEGGDWSSFLQPPVWVQAESSRPVPGGSVNTSPVAEGAVPGPSPQVNRAKSVPRARPIKLY
ncbi:hypothetical protein ACIPMW_34475 [Streptomyces sp. NPDC086669]|uniref:hypothetical protein n=1 Tax=Streptomyces sp. NPDC086669 TaxID=3365753 RepID=UPI0038073F71